MSAERDALFQRLLRSITLSEGEFALLLAQFNLIDIRDRLITDLKLGIASVFGITQLYKNVESRHQICHSQDLALERKTTSSLSFI